MTALVPWHKAYICLGTQAVFNCLYKRSLEGKLKHKALTQQLATIAEMYAKEHPELTASIDTQMRNIREITHGVPVTESLSPHFAIAKQTAQLGDAENQILKTAYKKVASLVHPDKKGGSVEQFQQAELAYATGNYMELTDMYVALAKFPDLFWRQSPEGIEYVSTEVSRPSANLQILRASLLFKVSQYHIQGNIEAASATMKLVLINQLSALLAELDHLRSQHGNR